MPEPLTYTQYLYSISNPAALQYMLDLTSALNSGQITPAQFITQVETVTGKVVKPVYSKTGDILTYTLNETATVTTPNPINSNASTVNRGAISRPVATTVEAGESVVTSSGVTGIGTRIATGCALVGCAAAAVATGVTLGKYLAGTFYNANPDFWDSNNMSSVNPETWSAITAGQEGLGADLINFLFDFDPNTGESQAYMSADAFAYFATYLQSQNAFSNDLYGIYDSSSLPPYSFVKPISNYKNPIIIIGVDTYTQLGNYINTFTAFNNNNSVYYFAIQTNTSGTFYWQIGAWSLTSFRIQESGDHTGVLNSGPVLSNTPSYGYYTQIGISFYDANYIRPLITTNNIGSAIDVGFLLSQSNISGSIEGMNTQSGAITPHNLTENPAQNLTLLQQQYPDLFNNAITYPVVQPDGTVRNDTYVPVAMPNVNTRTDTQPATNDTTQAHPQIDTSMQELIEELVKILQNPYPQPDTDPNDTSSPENPTDTGDGSGPVPIIPVGSASALWKIYHPTQTQIDSFGGWLWSNNFVDQILKIFNNPMEAIIGLHKVYATPIDAGTTTIKVGYLDSQVPSAYIEQQYIDVSCGSINLNEQFGNVFDYSPFTDIQLYLPFIGIVPLNVADIMRSTIAIKYGVDVITGACLAQVTVSRDNNSSVLYQYSGNCAVQYPISSGSYMGIVSSIISVAGGVAATVASGGAAAPLALGAAGGLLNARTSVQHSGGFSGNAGAMGGKIPYLIINRPQTKVAPNFEKMDGYPTNNYINVGDCTGYIKASSVHVIDVNATDDELKEINDLLLSGIII